MMRTKLFFLLLFAACFCAKPRWSLIEVEDKGEFEENGSPAQNQNDHKVELEDKGNIAKNDGEMKWMGKANGNNKDKNDYQSASDWNNFLWNSWPG